MKTTLLVTGLALITTMAHAQTPEGPISGGGPIPPGVVTRVERIEANDPVVREQCLNGAIAQDIIAENHAQAATLCEAMRPGSSPTLVSGVYLIIEEMPENPRFIRCVGYAPASCD